MMSWLIYHSIRLAILIRITYMYNVPCFPAQEETTAAAEKLKQERLAQYAERKAGSECVCVCVLV